MEKSGQPYYAVIFTSKLSTNTTGYSEMSDKMVSLAQDQKGFLGIESARSDIGITVSYWKDLDDIAAWKQNSEHLVAQQIGIKRWYDWYDLKICKVEREYSFKTKN